MNVIDAFKSDKLIKRKESREWISSSMNFLDSIYLTKEDLLADDWEVKQEYYKLTREQLYDICSFYYSEYDNYNIPNTIEAGLKELNITPEED